MWIFLLYLSACLCQCVDVYNLSYGQRAAQLATGLIIISGPRLKPSLDLNHLSSPWALHLIEWGLGNHGAVCQTYWCNSAAWIMTAVIYSGITGISVAVLLNRNFPCFLPFVRSDFFVRPRVPLFSGIFRLTSGSTSKLALIPLLWTRGEKKKYLDWSHIM